MTVTIRPLTQAEVPAFWQLAYSDPAAEWAMWNGPYFNDPMPTQAEFAATAQQRWVQNPLRRVILLDGALVGSVTAYYDDKPLNQWLEVGLAVFQADRWGQHIGRTALTLWLDHLFATTPLPHLGFTTWSGNERMMRLGAAVGMQCEGRIRQVRYWQGRYYDSVKYGILRSEWAARRKAD
ncbi:GNAT family N-acetyltransferase [Lacticaseibacillus kribbianus]|uniref:GNAT family N-acetyltransferase n=1 Tax=Lacticaseibacillus kribbianus TaxID=2926292 RepID=UPI001CD351D1|nr:GNAT family protein [Lacticaseibacillus kribbianus]